MASDLEERKLDQKTQQGINNLERKVTPKELTTQKDTEKQKKTPKSDRSHVVLWAKELTRDFVFLRPLGLRLEERKLDQKTQQGINNLERKVTPKEMTTQKDTEKQKKTPTSHWS